MKQSNISKNDKELSKYSSSCHSSPGHNKEDPSLPHNRRKRDQSGTAHQGGDISLRTLTPRTGTRLTKNIPIIHVTCNALEAEEKNKGPSQFVE